MAPHPNKLDSDSAPEKLLYVYGIFPGDIELDTELNGVGEPPGKVRIVHGGDLAALVSEVDESASLGSPRDLTTHKEILDSSASAVPVLPMRFGSVVADEHAVSEELLIANHDLFAAALGELDGRAQYVVKGRYDEEALLREVLAEDNEAARLGEQIRSGGSQNAKIRLGELISEAVAEKRKRDSRTLADRLDGLYEASSLREPWHERDAVHVALLVEADRVGELQKAVGDLAAEWEGRIQFRLLGPMAAYDFVGTPEPGVSS